MAKCILTIFNGCQLDESFRRKILSEARSISDKVTIKRLRKIERMRKRFINLNGSQFGDSRM